MKQILIVVSLVLLSGFCTRLLYCATNSGNDVSVYGPAVSDHPSSGHMPGQTNAPSTNAPSSDRQHKHDHY